MRMVAVTVVYNMDDEGKSLEDELRDWLEGNVCVFDFAWGKAKAFPSGEATASTPEGDTITITAG